MKDFPISEAINMLIEVSDFPDITPGTKFGTLGIDSLMAIDWLTMLEDRFDVEFNLRDLDFNEFNSHTVSEVVAEVRRQAAES